jgi:hypothetical protein
MARAGREVDLDPFGQKRRRDEKDDPQDQSKASPSLDTTEESRDACPTKGWHYGREQAGRLFY